MSTDDRKTQALNSRKDKADEKVKDLPTPQQIDKDEQIKGGKRKEII